MATRSAMAIVGVAIVAVGCGFYLYSNNSLPDVNGAPKEALPLAIKVPQKIVEGVESVACRTLPVGEVGKPVTYVASECVPQKFKDFHQWSKGKQEDFATQLMKNRKLTADEIVFLEAELTNKKLTALTRNNLANTLLQQREKNPKLYKTFLAMVDDPTETPQWRDYALQFLAQRLNSLADVSLAASKEEITNKLMQVVEHGVGKIQGTAIIQLALQEKQGTVKLGDGYSEVLAKTLQGKATTLSTKISLLAVMGQRRDVANLILIRAYAKQDAIASLKRTAIASLGMFGEAQDQAMLTAALTHENRAVQLAAKGALKRIEKSLHATVKSTLIKPTLSSTTSKEGDLK